jgi:hypothetical protein
MLRLREPGHGGHQPGALRPPAGGGRGGGGGGTDAGAQLHGEWHYFRYGYKQNFSPSHPPTVLPPQIHSSLSQIPLLCLLRR